MKNTIKASILSALVCLSGLLFSTSSPEVTVAQADKSGQLAAEKNTTVSAAVFEGQDTLLRPEGYREWVFAGSSTGLNYSPNPAPASANSREDIKHVYIHPAAYREFAQTGKFPEGTVMVLEIATAATKNEPDRKSVV